MNEEFEKNLTITRKFISTIFLRFYVWKGLQDKLYETTYKKNQNFWSAVLYTLKDNFLLEIAKILEKTNNQSKLF